MPRKPTIQNTILFILKEAGKPVESVELKERVKQLEKQRFKKRIARQGIETALVALEDKGMLEKVVYERKLSFKLTDKYHIKMLKNRLSKIVNSFSVENLHFEADANQIPVIVKVEPKAFIAEETGSRSPLGQGNYLDWSSPTEGIARMVVNDFFLLDDEDCQEGVANLLLWSFWKVVKNPKRTEELQNYLTWHKTELENAKNRGLNRRLAYEKSTVELIKITSGLLGQKNLHSFFNYCLIHSVEIKQLVKDATLTGINLGSIQKLFLDLMENQGKFIISELPVDSNCSTNEEILQKLEHLNFNEQILSRFFQLLIGLCQKNVIQSPLSKISGNYSSASQKAESFKSFLQELTILFQKRKAVIIYSWNVPLDKEAESYSKLSKIEEWIKSVKARDFYCFNPETIDEIEIEVRNKVKWGKEPKPVYLNWELTILDVYRLHPRGNDPDFWSEILDDMRNQNTKMKEGITANQDNEESFLGYTVIIPAEEELTKMQKHYSDEKKKKNDKE